MANIGYNFSSFDLNPDENRIGNNIVDLGVIGMVQPSKLSRIFFSQQNISLIQKSIKEIIAKKTHGQYIVEKDQDMNDLIVAMRSVYLTYSRFLDFDIEKQIRNLNLKLLNYIIPDMITALKQQYAYLKDINEPIKPEIRPLNVSSAGRKTLPSSTIVWQ